MKLLFLTYWYPYPPDMGTNIRVYNLLRQLQQIADLTLLSFYVPERGIPDIAAMQEICERVEVIPRRVYDHARGGWRDLFSLRPRSMVAERSVEMEQAVANCLTRQTYDLLIASEFPTLPYLVGKGQRVLCEELQAVLHPANVGRTRWGRQWLTWGKFVFAMRRMLRQCVGSTIASEIDQSLLRPMIPRNHSVTLLPNGVDWAGCQTVSADFHHPTELIHPGSVNYDANFDAVQFFVRDIFPQIRAINPNARLTVTGRAEPQKIAKLGAPNVHFSGHVPDVWQRVAAARITVVPLRIGSGTRLKILESMALGTPVVATRKGAEGLDVTDGENILLADSVDAFAAACLRLLNDDALCQRLTTNAKQLVAERYDWAKIGVELRQLIHNLTNHNERAH